MPVLLRAAIAAGALLALAGPAAAAAPTPTPTPPDMVQTAPMSTGRLDADVSALPGRASINVADTHGSSLYSASGSGTLMPASTMKIITAAAALQVLGPDARLSTRVIVAGPGRVVLTGGADPLLTTADLQALAARTAAWWTKAGSGPLTVTVDDALLGTPSPAPGWAVDYQPYQVAPVRSLARHGDRSWNASTKAAAVFVDALTRAGVTVTRGGRERAADGQSVIAATSHRLTDALAVMLGESDNDIAETLHLLVGVTVTGRTGWAAATTAVRAVLTQLDVDPGAAVLADGSGLSRANRVPATLLTDVLARSVDTAHPRLAGLEGLLPLAGRTGTLGPRYDRFVRGPSVCARGRVHAKTGSIRGVISLAGIARTDTGQARVFAFTVNDIPAKVNTMTVRHRLDDLAATVQGCLA